MYEVCARDLGDLERITEAYRKWLGEHAEWLDKTL